MKKLLLSAVALATLAGAAQAADLPYRRSAPAPMAAFVAVPVFTWTGFYVGANVGYISNEDGRTVTTGNNGTLAGPGTLFNTASDIRRNSLKQQADGFTGGGQIGYNYQVGRLVFGLEADFNYTDLESNRTVYGSRPAAAGFAASSYRSQMDYLGTVRGRLGYALTDQFLVYGTGGLAYGDVKNTQLFYAPSAGAGALQFAATKSDMLTGYAVGGGVEYAIPAGMFSLFSSAATVKLEALYYDLGKQDLNVPAVGGGAVPGTSYTSRTENSGVIARAGLNWKFSAF